MYVCEELFFVLNFCVSFLFLSLCSVVHYARDCSCIWTWTWTDMFTCTRFVYHFSLSRFCSLCLQPRSWKYENDELNRRVRREGSIERREEVAERELSPTDVRRKLVKRVLPVPQPSPRGPGSTQSKQIKESVDLSDFPPSPPSSPPPPPHPPAPSSSLLVPTPQKEAAVAKKEPAFPSDDSKSDRKRGDIATPLSPHPPRPPAPSNSHLVPTSQKAAAVAEGVSTAIAKKEAAFLSDESKSDRDSGDVVKEALQVLSSQLRGDKETPKKSQQKDSKSCLPCVTYVYVHVCICTY